MMTGNKDNEVVLVLSQEEYDYMYKLLLDYGSYAPPETMRTALARKISRPALVRDDEVPTLFSWFRSFLPSFGRNSASRAAPQAEWARNVSDKTNSPLTTV